MANLLDEQGLLSLDGFFYAEYRGMHVEADRCDAFKGCGLLFYKKGELVARFEQAITSVQLVEHGEAVRHYYINAGPLGAVGSETLYLKKKPRKEETPRKEGDMVYRQQNDETWKLTMLCCKEPEAAESLAGQIETDFAWKVKRTFEGAYAEIERKGQTAFVPLSSVRSWEEITNAGAELRKIMKEKEEK